MNIIGVILAITLIGTFVYGWIVNIVWMLQQTPFIADVEGILSIIGVFIAPLGAIMGWLH